MFLVLTAEFEAIHVVVYISGSGIKDIFVSSVGSRVACTFILSCWVWNYVLLGLPTRIWNCECCWASCLSLEP